MKFVVRTVYDFPGREAKQGRRQEAGADGRKQERTAGGRGRRQEKNILRRAVQVRAPTPATVNPLPSASCPCFLCVGPSGSDHPAAFDRLGGALVDAREVGAVEAEQGEAVGAERVERGDVRRAFGA